MFVFLDILRFGGAKTDGFGASLGGLFWGRGGDSTNRQMHIFPKRHFFFQAAQIEFCKTVIFVAAQIDKSDFLSGRIFF